MIAMKLPDTLWCGMRIAQALLSDIVGLKSGSTIRQLHNLRQVTYSAFLSFQRIIIVPFHRNIPCIK